MVPNSSIKNEKMYEDLRKEGNSKEKSARISNAAAARGKKSVGRKGGKAGSYDDWSVADLKKRAKELGVTGYSGLTKDKLVAKLRNPGLTAGRRPLTYAAIDPLPRPAAILTICQD